MTLQKVRNYQTYHYVNMWRSSSLDADICDEEFADLVSPKKTLPQLDIRWVSFSV